MNIAFEKHKAIIAFDVDGTLLEIGKWPNIIRVKPGAVEALKELDRLNYYVILWTCRGNECGSKNLEAAVKYLEDHDVPFHKVNEHHPFLIEKFQNDTRKVCADIYVDDKNLGAHKQKDYPNFYTIVEAIEETCNAPDFISVLHQSNIPLNKCITNRYQKKLSQETLTAQ